MQLVIWLSVLTDHQSHTFRSLQSYLQTPINFVVGSRMLSVRKAQGWNFVETDDLELEDLPAQGWWSKGNEIFNRYPDAIHLFGGLWADRRLFPLLILAQMRGVTTALMMEPYADRAQSYFGVAPSRMDKMKAIFRPLAYRLAGALVARRLLAAFPISEKATEQLRQIGVKDSRLFPFGYFVPLYEGSSEGEADRNKGNMMGLRIVFVGSLITRKGLSILLSALQICIDKGVKVSLDVYGPGTWPNEKLSPQGVKFCGPVQFGKVQNVIRGYDLLVLPSLHDGWGVVVNEALLQGVPVIVSDTVGARTLVEKSGAGKVFSVSDAQGLATIIAELVRTPQLLFIWREAAENFQRQLSPEVAGNYLYECLLFSSGLSKNRPRAPWYL